MEAFTEDEEEIEIAEVKSTHQAFEAHPDLCISKKIQDWILILIFSRKFLQQTI
jgi:hypothetical protein